jgi:uncharacterized MAPEG superfamily protein
MTIELTMLLYTTLLLFVLVGIQATAGVRTQGLSAMAGPRDDLPAPGLFQARTKRVVDNHREGVALFAPVVLIAAAANISSGQTALGCEIFFASRVVHAGLYLLGVPHVRPLVYAVGLVGWAMVVVAIILH